MVKQNTHITLHCKIDEKTFSRALFLGRFFTGAAMVYLALGSLLYWREFMVNTFALKFPFATYLSFFFAGAELFLGLFLILGWYTRLMSLLSLLFVLLCAGIFFAGNYNPVFIALCILSFAPFTTLFLLGPGIISLDYKRSQRAASRTFRG